MSDNDPTENALAAIAAILEHPEPAREADEPVVDEQPLAPEPADADGYTKVGPGPMEAIRFRWTVRRGDDDNYYVHETIGQHSAPLIVGPMTSEAAVRLVDERESEAQHRFEALRNEISGRAAVAEMVHRDSGEA